MRFLNYSDIPHGEIRHTFKSVSWKSLATVALLMAAITGYAAIPKGEATSTVHIVVPGMVALFFGALFARRFKQCRNPRNWLVKLSDTGIYLNLQSEVGAPAAKGVEEVLYIPRETVAGIGGVRELRILPGRHGDQKMHFAYFDILVDDPVPEALLLALARIRRNPALRNGAGIRRDLHCPVRIENAHTLRLVWDWMTPGEDEAAKVFAAEYGPAAKRKTKGPTWSKLSIEERGRYIDTLWEWGYVEDAIRLSAMMENISSRTAARNLADRLG